MGLLDWFLSSTPKIDETRVSQTAIDEAIDYVVKVTDARLTLVNHYRPRLTGPITRTLEYLNGQREHLPAVHEANRLSWSLDPTLRAMFGQSADLVRTFTGCNRLRDYAASASALEPIHAVLGMDFEEQRRFGTGMQGQMLVRDIARTAISFSHHRMRLFAQSKDELNQAFSRRLFDELALIALERMQAEVDTRRDLEENRLLLSTRLNTFNQRGMGADSFLGEAGASLSPEESLRLLHELEENETRLAALGCPSESLDRQLDYLAEVLAEPMEYVSVERRQVYLDSMNTVVEPDLGEAVEFGIVTFRRQQPVTRAFLPLRIDRSLIGEGRKLTLEGAERWL